MEQHAAVTAVSFWHWFAPVEVAGSSGEREAMTVPRNTPSPITTPALLNASVGIEHFAPTQRLAGARQSATISRQPILRASLRCSCLPGQGFLRLPCVLRHC
jgi:hypothetical protein